VTDKLKVRVYSDLHLDWYADNFAVFKEGAFWYPPELDDDKDTILCLCGDIWTGTRWIEFAGFSWIAQVAPRFKQVLIVLGNHDHWDLAIIGAGDKCNAMLQDAGLLNVHVLDCDTFAVGDYLFVGCTLWTDMRDADPLVMHAMPQFMSYDGSIAYQTGKDGAWERFTSVKWVQVHAKHKKYIDTIARQNKDKKIVVMTHHVPLEILGDPTFGYTMSNHYYYSDLSNLILDNDNIIAWFYGHTHFQANRVFPDYAGDGGCWMVNNAVGYVGQHMEQQGKVAHEVLEL